MLGTLSIHELEQNTDETFCVDNETLYLYLFSYYQAPEPHLRNSQPFRIPNYIWCSNLSQFPLSIQCQFA